jgi:hypothetical protein
MPKKELTKVTGLTETSPTERTPLFLKAKYMLCQIDVFGETHNDGNCPK